MTVTPAEIAIAPTHQGNTLPAGGADPDRFDWAEAWYPIAYVGLAEKVIPPRER